MADSDSSPESTPAETTVSTAPDVAPAESSPAETPDTGAPKSMTEAVHAALQPKDADEAPPASSQDQDPTKAAPTPEKVGEQAVASDELSETEKAALKGKTKKSFDRLVRNIAEQGQQIETLNTRVAEYDRVVDYLKSTKLRPDEIDSVFDIATTMKSGNPHEALRKLAPIVNQLQRMAGVELPSDLAEQVRQGYLTEQHARNLATAQSEAQFARAREQQAAQDRAKADETARYTTHMSSLVNTADEWERAKTGTDPDWSRKAARVHELAKLEVLEKGPPPSAQHAVEMFNRIYDRVTTDLRALMPKPNPVRGLNGGGSSTRSVAEPKSMLEAIRMSTRSQT